MVTEHNTTYRTYRWLVGPLVPHFRAKKAIGTRVNWLRWTSSLSGQVDRKTAQPKGRGWRGAELYAYANFLSRDDVKLGAPNSFAPSKKKIKKGGHEKSISFQFISIHFNPFQNHFWIGLLMMAFSIFSPPFFPGLFHPLRSVQEHPAEVPRPWHCQGRLPRGGGALRRADSWG